MAFKKEEVNRLDALANQMAEMRGQGVALAEIAERFGTTVGAVRYRTRASENDAVGGGKAKGTMQATEQETAQMWALYVRGASQRQISERYSISQQAVGQRLKRYRENLPETEREVIFRRELDLLDELRRHQMTIFHDEDQDTSIRLAAADRVLKGMERLARMMGLDSPIGVEMDGVVRYEITGVDPAVHS